MRRAALTLLLAVLPAPAMSARLPHSVSPAFNHRIAPYVVVSIVPLPGGAPVVTSAERAVADLGRVSANSRSAAAGVEILSGAHSYDVSTTIGLRATASALGSSPVSLVAFLDAPLPGITVRIDGIELGDTPVVIEAGAPAAVVTRHRLEIEIPNTMSPITVPSEIPIEFGALP